MYYCDWLQERRSIESTLVVGSDSLIQYVGLVVTDVIHKFTCTCFFI